MNAPFVVAQATSGQNSATSAPRTIKIAKPEGSQAITVRLDGATRLDLSDISSENITLVRVGERLVILFDNQATVTVEPFFDSSGQPQQDLSLQVGPDRIVTGGEFANLFPISTDQSILPAAGDAAAGRNTGGQFGSFQIDGFGDRSGLDLLGGEAGAGPGGPAEFAGNGAPTALDLALGLDEDEIDISEGNLGGDGDDVFPSTITGTLPIDFGPDGFGDLFFNVASGPVPGLTSGGDPVTYTVSADGLTITASTVNGPVFTIALVVNGDSSVTYTVTLFASLDHPGQDNPATSDVERAFEDNILLDFPFTVQDSNGDTATATLTLNVDDDTPIVNVEGIEDGTVDEDGIGNLDDGYAGDVAGGALSATGSLGLSWGADRYNDVANGGVSGAPLDGDRAVVFADLADGVLTPAQAATFLTVTGSGGEIDLALLTSGGESLVYTLSGNGTLLTVTSTSAAPVFTVTLSDATDTGSYTFTLQGPLDHPEGDVEDDLVLAFDYTAYDSDGDAIDGTFAVTVDDDGPIAGEGTASTVEDEAVNSGNDESDGYLGAVSGISLNIAWGADNANDNNGQPGDRSVAFTDAEVAVSGAYGETLTSLGETVSFTVLSTGELVGYTGSTVPATTGAGNVVFFASLSDVSNGEYSFTLVKPLDHADDAGNGENSLSLTFNYTATDADGDSSDNTFTVNVVDDVPLVGTPENGNVEEEEGVVEGAGNEDTGPNPQDEDYVVIIFPVLGETTEAAGGSLAISWGSDDADDENGQPGDRSVAFGPDAVADLDALNLTSRGDEVNYTIISVAGGQALLAYTGSVAPATVPATAAEALAANIVFMAGLSDNGDGSWAFRLFSTVEHQGSVQGEDTLTLPFQFVATDSDGDTTDPATFQVGVIDDVPFAIGTILDRYVEEEELSGGNEDFAPGGLLPDGDGGLGYGVTTLQAGGPLLISWGGDDSNTAVNGGFDGTQAPGDRSVVFDVASPAGGTQILTDAQVDGFVSVSGPLNASTLTSEGRELTYELSADNTVLTARAGSEVIFTVTLSDEDSGSYLFTLSGVLDHPNSSTTEDLLSLEFRFAARDGDGDIATNDFTVNIIDDVPVAGVGTASTVEDEAVNSGNNESDGLSASVTGISLNIAWGADDANGNNGQPGDRSVAFTNANVAVSGAYNGTSLTSLGEAVSFAILSNGTLIGYTGSPAPTNTGNGRVVFFASVSDANDGEYSFTLKKPLDHADDAGNGESSLSLTFNYTATDSDGDTSSNTFTVSVVDDVPLIGTPATGTVEEEESVVEGAGNEDTGPNPQDEDYVLVIFPVFGETDEVANGTLGISWGSDNKDDENGQPGDRSVAFGPDALADLAALDLTSRGDEVNYTVISVPGGQALLAYTGSVAPTTVPANAAQALAANIVFMVGLSDNGSGSYAFRLFSTLDHQGSVQGEDTLTLPFQFVATDSDGDTTDPATFQVGVIDDEPFVIGTILDRYVEEEELQGGNEDVGPGLVAPDGDIEFFGFQNLTTAQAGGPLNIAWGGDDSNTAVNGGFDGTQAAGDRSVVFDVASPMGGSQILTDAQIDAFLSVGGPLNASDLTSNTVPLVYELSADNTVLTARAGTEVIFTVTLSDQDSGSYVFTLSGVLDHPVSSTTEDELSLTFRFAARDGDGDVATDDFTVNIIDDVPVIGTPESGSLAEASTELVVANGSFEGQSLATGAPGVITHPLGNYMQGHPSGWTLSNPSEGGIYSPTPAITQAAGHAGDAVAWLRGGATLAQTTGETLVEGANYTLHLNIGDRTDQTWPGGTVRLVAVPSNTEIALLNLPNPGEGLWTGVELSTGAIPASLAGETLRIEIIHPNTGGQILVDNVELTVVPPTTDDGSLEISWGADNNPALRTVVFDAALADNEAVATTDGPLTSNGASILLVRVSDTQLYGVADDDNDGVVTDAGRIVFIVTIEDGANPADEGAWHFQLLDNVDHVPGANDTSLSLDFGFTATDSDGDETSSSFTVSLTDDTPQLGPISDQTVAEVTLSPPGSSLPNTFQTQTLSDVSLNIDWGSDDADPDTGAIDRKVEFDPALNGSVPTDLESNGVGLIYVVSADGTMLTAYRFDGTNYISGSGFSLGPAPSNSARVFTVQLSDLENGSYTFTLYDNLDHNVPPGTDTANLPLNFGFRAIDADGDATNLGTITITVTDNVPVVLGAADQGNVTEVGLPTVSFTSGDLNIDWNSDDRGSAHLEFVTDGGGTPLVSPALTSDGIPLVYLVRTNLSGEEEVVAFKQGDAQVDANAVFIVALNSPGNPAFAFSLFQNLDHTGANQGSLPITFTARAVDGDGDSVEQSFTVNVADSTPTAPDSATPNPVSEDAASPILSNVALGVAWGSDNDNVADANNVDRSLTFSSTSIVLTGSSTISTLTSNGVALQIVPSAGNTVLTAYRFDGTNYFDQNGNNLGSDINAAAAAQVFVVTLDDAAATGAYTFELLQPLDHPAPNLADEHYIDLTFAYTVTDADGDPDAGGFTVRVDAAGTISSISYDGLSSGVFVNLSDADQTIGSETVGAHKATDRASVADKVVGIDDVTGIDDAYGSDADDILVGNDQANTLGGNDGDDLIIGGAGDDTLAGGIGDDTFVYNPGNGAGIIGDGSDTIDGGGHVAGDLLKVTRLASHQNRYDITATGTGFNLTADHNFGGPAEETIATTGIEKVDIDLKGNEWAVVTGNLSGVSSIDIEGDAGGQTVFLFGLASATAVTGNLLGGNDDVYGGAHATGAIIEGGTGIDTLDYSVTAGPVTIDLAVGTVTRNGGVVDHMTGFENAIGTGASDQIYGSEDANVLSGLGGNDIMKGGGGSDTLHGGAGNDLLYGDGFGTIPGADVINGGDDNDTAYGGAGEDVIHGDAGNDALFGEGDNDTIFGDAGDDFVEGGAGNDTLSGGTNTSVGDTVSYETATGSVTVDLNLVTAQNTVGAGLDTLSGFEHLRGSNFGDNLRGDGGDNELYGLFGDDFLIGGPGNDTLDGGDGADTVDHSLAAGTVRTNLSGTAVNGALYGFAAGMVAAYTSLDSAGGTDTLISMENWRGGNFNDLVIGSVDNNLLEGNGGDDVFVLNVGDGVDIVHGGTEGANGDLLDITNTGGATTFTIAATGGADPITIDTDGVAGAEVTLSEIEDIAIHLGGGGDTVNVTTPLGGTSISTSTITIEGGAGDDTVNASGINAGHPVKVEFSGNGGNDTFTGGAGNDVAVGGGGVDSTADRLFGGGGNDTLYGNDSNLGIDANKFAQGGENDVAAFSGNASDYAVTWNAGLEAWEVTRATGGGPEGVGSKDTLYGIEGIDFGNNGSVELDLTQPVLLLNSLDQLIGTFGTIQAAVDAAGSVSGFVSVVVAPGTYTENVTIDRGNITLRSMEGRGETSIVGVPGGPENATITVQGGLDNVKIGTSLTTGFTIVGFDHASPAIETAAVFLEHTSSANPTDNFEMRGNDVVANGDGGLLSAWDAAITDAVIAQNIFSGKTFDDTQPIGGPGDQFVVANMPRQLVAFGQGSDPVTNQASNILFHDNQVTGTAGGVNLNGEQGNTLVTIDAANSTISSNLFTGFTNGTAYSLRVRGPGTSVVNNQVDHDPNNSESQGFFVNNQGVPGTYGGNSVDGAGANEILFGTPGNDGMVGDVGNDTIYGLQGNDTINADTGDDIIVYNPGNGAGTVGDGNDIVDGGGHVLGDTLKVTRLASLQNRYNITANGSGFKLGVDHTFDGFPEETVTVTAVEKIDIDLKGNEQVVVSGNLSGVSSIDIEGDANGQSVFLFGLGSATAVTGMLLGGNDEVYGGSHVTGAVIDGGAGIDTLNYVLANGPISVDLQAGTVTRNGGVADQMTNFENAVGSSFADVLRGTSGANILSGDGGNDRIHWDVTDGHDTVSGGAGTDTLLILTSTTNAALEIQASGSDFVVDTFPSSPGTLLDATSVEVIEVSFGNNFSNRLDIGGGVTAQIMAWGTNADGIALGLGGGQDYFSATSSIVTDWVDARGGDSDRLLYTGVSNATGGGVVQINLDTTAYVNGSVNIAAETATWATATLPLDVYTDRIRNFEHAEGGGGQDTIIGTAGFNQLSGYDGNDVLVGHGGDDDLRGGQGNDTFYETVGDGRDLVDGGTETTADVYDLTGTGNNENFFIEIPSEYVTRTGNAYSGSAEILVSTGSNIEAELTEIEDIVVHGGGGADNLTVSGSFAGTSLLTSTIHFEGGEGNDSVDVSDRTSPHRVVADGGNGSDTVVLGFNFADATYQKIFDGSTLVGVKITHGGAVDEFRNFESFDFTNGTRNLDQLFNSPPDARDDSLVNIAYHYAGSYRVSDGPHWGTNPPVYSAQGAAALLFGGNAADYAISVNSSLDPATITHSGWYDGWGKPWTVFPEGFSQDAPPAGYYAPFGDAWSAYVSDHIDLSKTNYVWHVQHTPYGTEDGTIAISSAALLANDSDPNGDSLSIVSVSVTSALGAAVTLAGGVITYDPTSATDIQKLAAGQQLTDSFSYTVSDGNGGSDTATASFTITGSNDAPVVSASAGGAGNEGTGTFAVDLLSNASDVDSGAVLHVENVVWDEVPAGFPAGFVLSGNAITVDTDSVLYDSLAVGQTFESHFTYDVVDEHGARVTQHATITITGTNEAPTGQGGTLAVNEDVTHVFTLANFGYNDADGDAMAGVTIASLGSSTGRLLYANAPVTPGQFISAASIVAGMLTFAPADDLANANRSFTFQVVDSAGESDATARTMTMSIDSRPDGTTPTGSSLAGIGTGIRSLYDEGGSNDTLLMNEGSAQTYTSLNFFRSDNNLEIGWTSNLGLGKLTVIDQYVGSNTFETFTFGSGDAYAGLGVSSGSFKLVNGLTGAVGNVNEIVAGSAASETLAGDNGVDLLFGNGGHDILEGGNHNDILVGGLGDDTLRAGNHDDHYVFGLADGSDTIEEASGSDRIVILTGGAALSSLYAYDDDTGENAGNLVIEFNGQRITVSDHYAGGNDAVEKINFNGGSFAGYEFGTGDYTVSSADPDGSPRTVFENAGVSHFIAGELDTINIIGGINQNDVLIGGNLVDSLSGGAGNDLLVGGAGGDILFGGLGSDVLIGGEGADEFRFLSGDDGGPTVDDADSILDFRDSGNDVIEILGAGSGGFSIGGLSAGSQEAVFGKTADATFGSTSERFHYDTSSNTLWYDADGSDSGFTAVALARLENGYDLQGNQITVI